jgi:hypothetical protein
MKRKGFLRGPLVILPAPLAADTGCLEIFSTAPRARDSSVSYRLHCEPKQSPFFPPCCSSLRWALVAPLLAAAPPSHHSRVERSSTVRRDTNAPSCRCAEQPLPLSTACSHETTRLRCTALCRTRPLPWAAATEAASPSHCYYVCIEKKPSCALNHQALVRAATPFAAPDASALRWSPRHFPHVVVVVASPPGEPPSSPTHQAS